MKESYHIYDQLFKMLFRTAGIMLIRFINKVFGKNFPLNSKIVFIDPNGVPAEDSELEMDLYFTICGETFHIEAQAYDDDMMIRLIEYAFSNVHDKYEKIDSTHARYHMVDQAVVFLKDFDRTKDKLYITLVLPDKREIEYALPAVRALGYTPKELVENDMEILLPFQILRLYRRAKNYHRRSEEAKKKFLTDFEKMINEIITTLDSLKKDKRVTNEEYRLMLEITRKIKDHIYNNIDDIEKQGADRMLNERIILYTEEAEAKGREEGKAELIKDLAVMMIKDGKPLDEIERYTGKTFEELTEIAASLGKGLVLPKKSS
ncbi:MAG: hypothetical protein IJL67_08600 [Oscillospiraceae bacterium]|nr:hypothetical protein [Oscillospiraceae bacterium]